MDPSKLDLLSKPGLLSKQDIQDLQSEIFRMDRNQLCAFIMRAKEEFLLRLEQLEQQPTNVTSVSNKKNNLH
jgi:hypothetical protein